MPVTFAMLVGVLGVAWTATAQPASRIARIGLLVTGPPPGEHVCVQAFRRGLTEFGYVEGQTHVIETRWAEAGRPEEVFPAFAADLARAGVDLIVSVTASGLKEARDVIGALPVVMASSNYPVERGLIASLRRPGGTITGLATFTGEIHTKRLQLLRESLPGLSRVTVLRVAGDQSDLVLREFQKSARVLGVTLQLIEVRRGEDFPAAFQSAVRQRAQAVMTTQGPFFYQHARLIADLALKHRLPSISGEPGAAAAGMLMTHGANRIADSCHRAASYADRILKGARPADLPLEEPTRFELVVNLRTARTLGLALPPGILFRADRVIE